MNTIKYQSLLSICTLLSIIFLASCGGVERIVGGDGPEISNQEGLAKVKKLIEESFGPEKEVFSLSIGTKDHLTSEFGSASVGYLDNGLQYSHDYNVVFGDGQELQEPKMASKSFQKPFFLKKLQGKVKVKDFNYDQLLNKYQEAINMIPQEFESFELHEWKYEVNNQNKITAKFVIEGTKKGEKTSLQGRQMVTNYYQFSFKMDESGKLSLKE